MWRVDLSFKHPQSTKATHNSGFLRFCHPPRKVQYSKYFREVTLKTITVHVETLFPTFFTLPARFFNKATYFWKRGKQFFLWKHVTMTSQVHTSKCFPVFRIRWCPDWLSSAIRSQFMADYNFWSQNRGNRVKGTVRFTYHRIDFKVTFFWSVMVFLILSFMAKHKSMTQNKKRIHWFSNNSYFWLLSHWEKVCAPTSIWLIHRDVSAYAKAQSNEMWHFAVGYS